MKRNKNQNQRKNKITPLIKTKTNSQQPTSRNDKNESIEPKNMKAESKNILSSNQKPTANKLIANISDLNSRYSLASALGQTFEGNRDLYEVLGYKKSVEFKDYLALYVRQDIAKRVVESASNPIFNNTPVIESINSTLTTDIDLLFKTQKVYSYLNRVDILNRLGRYAVLLMGFDDGQPLESPIERASSLIYLRPYSEGSAEILSFEDEPTNPRCGLPLFYTITLSNDKKVKVHYSRVLHIAEGLLEDDVYGIPALKPVFNRLMDLEKVVGGSAEAFFMNASPGRVLMLEKDSIFDPGEQTDTQEQIEDYNMKLNKWLRLKGQKVESLSTSIHSPKSTFDCIVSLIAGCVGIPKRILVGSERAHLASSMDEVNWMKTLDDRRTVFVGPNIVRSFIERLQLVGVLPEAEFEIIWPELTDEIEESDENSEKGDL